MHKSLKLLSCILAAAFFLTACASDIPSLATSVPFAPSQSVFSVEKPVQESTTVQDTVEPFDLSSIPAYTTDAYVPVNNNQPYFTEADYATEPFEFYSDLDSLGRCGVAWANVCKEIMPTEPRGEIGSVKPSGWQTSKYDFVDGQSLYNRCHLIGFQLAGENANPLNLITGTRYMNVVGMLPFENMVDDYVDETGNHVLYRVTPIFEGGNLIAAGVLMEGWSVEDSGDGICFCVFAYNVQPGVVIDYANGDNHEAPSAATPEDSKESSPEETYILNTSSHKFHKPDCTGASTISEKNRKTYTGTRESLLKEGYAPCGQCQP